MALEIICAVVPTIAEHTFVPITRHLGYAFNYKSKVEKLQTQVQKLTAQRDGLQQRIDEARRQGNEINVDVKTWLSCVEKAIEQAKEVVDSEEQERGRCLLGLIPNLKKQYQLGKRAEVEMRPLEQLGNSNFDRISHRPPLRQIVAPSVYGTEGLNSRVFMSEKVIEALMDPAVNMVGVYGMGGVGKTTLAKEVHRQAIQDKLFDVVVMAAVSETPDLTKIQGTIADMLGIKLEEETEYGRACRLRQRLMNEKNILIILDDIWEQLEPEAVGIPLTPSHNGCKLLLTSRRKDVLEQGMGAERTLEVQVLSEAEAWSLFETTVGGVIDQALYSVANEIAKNCAGLPLLVVTVARALKNKELHEWKVALDELSRIDNEGIQAKAYSALELSYNHLVGEVKSFFLLCGQLARHDILVQDLVGYSMGLNLLKHKGTVEGARNRVHKLISDLKAACLLLDGDKSGFVKMHDVVRDAALAIGKSSQCIFTFRDASGLKEWPNKNLLRSCTRISLPYFEMDELPERLECPELELLLFGIEKNPHLRIPDSFFEMARKLRVLDFRGLLCLSLPRSLGFLSSLYTLCLHGCQLGDTAFIGELKSLEILSFRGSEVRQLPREIGQLTRLKLLDLSECYHLEVIPPNVISRLSMLEERYMGDCFNIQWEVEGISNPSNASLAELRNLSLLKILEILVPDAKMLPEDLFRNHKLEKYNICIGAGALERKKISIGASWYYSLYETSRTLKLKLETNSHMEHGIGAMLKEAEHLSLDVSEGFKSMFYDPDWEGFPKLKNLSLANCHDIQYIINFVNQVPFDAFPALESLSLLDLMNLEKFCHGQLPTGSFSKLRIIEVYGCYRLKNLFSFSMVRNLPELQKIKVSDCPEMEEIIGGESGIKGDEVDEVAEFPELRCLRLSRLPLLVNFCSKLTSQTREEQLTLFNRRVLFPNLEELKVKAIGGEIRQDNEVSVVSSSCLKLKHLFLSSFVRSHERIKKLQISRCESIEGIVLTEEETINNTLRKSGVFDALGSSLSH